MKRTQTFIAVMYQVAMLAGCKPGTAPKEKATDPAAIEENDDSEEVTSTETDSDTDEDVTSDDELGDGSDGFVVSGTLALTAGLVDGLHITHVVALNTESGKKRAFPVDPVSGKFRVILRSGEDPSGASYINDDGTVDREALVRDNPESAAEIEAATDEELIAMLNEGDEADESEGEPEASPWTLAYVDASQVGPAMMISRFAAETLDTLSPIPGNPGLLMGEVTPVAGDKAEATVTYADVLDAMGMSATAADTFGAIDDVSLRYINPDIDGDGVLDAIVIADDGTPSGVEKNFMLDFHNRFNVTDADGGAIWHTSLKNVFADELLGGLENLRVEYTGTGIVPELDPELFTAAPTSYQWKFESPVTVGSGICDELSGGGVLAAGDWCTQAYTVEPNYPRYQLGMEVTQPPEGTYVLNAGEQVLTWTNIKVSDFSAGIGFVILLVKYVVDGKGTEATNDDVMTGIAFKYLKKTADGWVPALDEELKLIIKGDGGGISLKFDDNTLNCGMSIPKTSTGTIDFATATIRSMSEAPEMTALLSELAAGTVLFDRFSSGAASYDDKLGMRFFF